MISSKNAFRPRLSGLTSKTSIFFIAVFAVAAAYGQNKPFEMLVMGDSVVWGQGLKEENKFSTIVSREIEKKSGRTVHILNKSHSGAAFLAVDKSDLVHPGEIPSITPTLWQQLDLAIADYKCVERAAEPDKHGRKHYRCSGVDFVLFNGGINDLGVPKLLNPLTTESAIKKDSRKYCYEEMKAFLSEVMATFDKATVVVTGYFPIICTGKDGTDPHLIRKLATSFITGGKNNQKLTTRPDSQARDWFMERISKRSTIWKNASDADLESAVISVNESAGARRAIFAKIDFKTEECYGGTETNLFQLQGFDSKRDPITDDQLLSERIDTLCPAAQTAMNNAKMSFLSRIYHVLLCEPAGAGHPNAKGARKYADSILAGLPQSMFAKDASVR